MSRVCTVIADILSSSLFTFMEATEEVNGLVDAFAWGPAEFQ